MKIKYILLSTLFSVAVVNAGDSTLDAAIGGGLGGAVGAAIGNEVGGREGAIVGGALGGGIGAAITRDDKSDVGAAGGKHGRDAEPLHKGQPSSRFCPPGQAKKGRC
ncbi:MAG: hypothetical protein JKX92_07615 [Porticoccaceae bacterium]|nr:hypothetical protein [Porticoccaceae bacterium]